MGKQELIIAKECYLESRHLDCCTPEELADALGISGKSVRSYLRKDRRAFDAVQNASGFWTIYKSKCSTVAKENALSTVNMCKSEQLSSVDVGEDYKEGLEPWIGENPRVLILGSLPGDMSLKTKAYYANSNNVFWKIMRALFSAEANSDNKGFIMSNGIALWDSAFSGKRKGSSDSALDYSTIVPNDIASLLANYPTIKTIIFNGRCAEKIFECYNANVNCKKIRLVSTSSQARGTFEYKLDTWSILKELVK